jgi:hypothetical protein
VAVKRAYHFIEERDMNRIVSFVILTVVLLGAQPVAFSQGSGSSRLSPPRQTRPQTPAEFQQSFWKHITVTSPYRDWERWPAGADDPRAASEPHGPWAKTYAKAAGTTDPTRLGYGSIIVQEEFEDDKSTLNAISVMYCVKGVDPAHYDWYWLKYTPEGEVVRAPREQGGKPIAGKVQSCINCHQKARADLVYSNDEGGE